MTLPVGQNAPMEWVKMSRPIPETTQRLLQRLTEHLSRVLTNATVQLLKLSIT
ncbi:EspF repeat-containing protein, partial [Fructilactobacillus florum]|uniref:EspF repeat-containing protein n=1 Tax=Fructilactobacillus florum TaxID=640331 RepID=UPI003B8A60CD